MSSLKQDVHEKDRSLREKKEPRPIAGPGSFYALFIGFNVILFLLDYTGLHLLQQPCHRIHKNI